MIAFSPMGIKARVKPARDRGAERRLDTLLSSIEYGLAAKYTQMVARARGQLQDHNSLQEAAKVIAAEAIRYTDALEAAFVAAGRAEAKELSRQLGRYIRFDPTHEMTAEFITEARRRFLQGFTAEQRQTISQAIVRASRAHFGQDPTELIAPIKKAAASGRLKGKAKLRGPAREALGLTPYQEGIVHNYRVALANNSAEAIFNRKLRDRRFDGSTQTAIDNNEPLSWKQINRMVDRYRERWISHRAQTIARTNALTTLNTARHAALHQAAEQANFYPDAIVRTWNAVMDSRTRDSHAALDGYDVEGMDEPFPADGGPLLYPGDPNGPPAEIINCRCWLTYSLPGEKEPDDD